MSGKALDIKISNKISQPRKSVGVSGSVGFNVWPGGLTVGATTGLEDPSVPTRLGVQKRKKPLAETVIGAALSVVHAPTGCCVRLIVIRRRVPSISGKAATMPPRHVEPKGAMARSVHHEVVFGARAPFYMRVQASTNRGFDGLFGARLTFLGFSAGGCLVAFGGSATLPTGIGT